MNSAPEMSQEEHVTVEENSLAIAGDRITVLLQDNSAYNYISIKQTRISSPDCIHKVPRCQLLLRMSTCGVVCICMLVMILSRAKMFESIEIRDAISGADSPGSTY